ncbi:single-stranded-DNA-specific exonuclease RecJ [Rossellomorea marisflavi]|uniref:single-stranded-DNA-specific exonuclease RecJ n=1 Tax=Rossellomorea marisflavi TaxID=189381 RepID=UPI003FA0A0AD
MNVKWELPKETTQRKVDLMELKGNRMLRHLHPSVIEVLYNRGYKTEEAITDFFDNDPSKTHNPLLMMDMEKGISYVIEAMNQNKHIVIYGDYDADGASSTAIAVLALRELGAHVDYFINNRFDHGYGIKPEGVDDLLKEFPTVDMIITVDNGIVAYEGIDYAKEKGIDIIVTDHHDPHPSGKMPDALAVINPKRPGDEYPFKGICGATVIYKFMLALYYELDKDLDYVEEMMDIVGMATIGDVMPLHDENRIFVKQALDLIADGTRTAFTKLVEKTNIATVNEEMFGFKFVPMINAPSRLLGKIDLAVDLFLSEDESEMEEIIDKLISLNEERKELTSIQEDIAMGMIQSLGDQPVYVLFNKDFHEGIVGLVAGRIKESFHRPTIVLTEHKGIAKGSGRSIEGFHVTDALHETSETLIGFGGHALACGMSLDVTKVDELRDKLSEMAESQLTEEDMTPKVKVDSMVSANDITLDYIDELDTLRPFGQGFEKPVLQLSNFEVGSHLYMGKEKVEKDKKHVKLMGKGKLSIVMFKYADTYRNLQSPKFVNTIGYPAINVYKNNVSIQFMVQNDYIRKA